MKVLVLENMHKITDAEISAFLHTQTDWKIDMLCNLGSVSANELVMKFAETDAITMQSLFISSKQFTAILQVIDLAAEMRDTPLKVYVLYGHKHFESFINTSINKDDYLAIKKMVMNERIHLYDIVHEEFQVAGQEKKYFLDREYRFDVVPMYYNFKRGIIFHTRRPLIKAYPDDMYRDESTTRHPSDPLTKRMNDLSRREFKDFKIMLSENFQRELDLKEDLETPGTWANESGDYEELMELRTNRLNILTKLGIQSYK